MLPYHSFRNAPLISAVLAVEAPDGLSREIGVLAAGVGSLDLGTVLGRRLFGALTITAGANTGNGAIAAATLGATAKVGAYRLTCVAAAANGGRFQVVDPDGYRLSDAVVGAAYAGGPLAFTVGDGSTDFAVGDSFVISVAEGDGKLVPLAPAAIDGTARAAAILLENIVVPTASDARAVVLSRFAAVLDGGLIWPDGITPAAQAAALKRLAAADIFTRRTV